MSRDTLQNLITSFDLHRFKRFFSEKNRKFKESEENLDYLADGMFSRGQKLGVLSLEDGYMIVCAIEAKKELTERSGKKAQYEIGKKVLKNTQMDAGIFIFYNQTGAFRFSLIYANYLGKKRDWNAFRRFTYFVSKELTNKTFLQRIGDGDFSALAKIKDAFSVEKVTKEFYEEIANWYFWAVENCRFPKDAKEEHAGRYIAVIRLITRMIFIWFMRERGLVRRDLFEESRVASILTELSAEESTYYQAILQNLFFATLSTKKEERKFRSEVRGTRGINPDFGNQNVYRYHELFRNPEKIENYFGEIPFLNGGLFECLDDKPNGIYIDGFTATKKHQPEVPNVLFFSDDKKADLNAVYGTKGKTYKVKGLLNILSSYNFTIDENSLDDQDIALDPELLGRVFENLLASYNPETSTTARKATGSYYTPREIVDYMVTESLKAYFRTRLSVVDDIDKKLDQLFSTGNIDNPFSRKDANTIVELIESVRIVDPAVGSGAFPMGALNKLVFLLNKLDPENELWKQAQLAAADSIPDPRIKKDAKNRIEEFFKTKNADYGRKLYLIQKCIYGVDIQEIAVEIAKLRFFISLLVDEKIDTSKDNMGIEPLPNLEFKIMQGNSLISEFLGVDFDNGQNKQESNGQAGLEIGLEDDSLIKEFERKKIDYQNEPDKDKKASLENEIENLMIKIFESRLQKKYVELRTVEEKAKNIPKSNNREEYIRSEKAKFSKKHGFDLVHIEEQLREFTSNRKTMPFFPWRLYFAEVFKNGGFDIVIGNPPYIQLQKGGGRLAHLYKNCGYKTYERTGDIYSLFYERGINLLRNCGHLCYITSNKWMRAGYGKSLRVFFLAQNPKLLVDCGPGVFENTTVDVNILIIQKGDRQNHPTGVTLKQQLANHNLAEYIAQNKTPLTRLTEEAWFIGSNAEQQLKDKIARIGKQLKEWNVNIYRGILTGLNEAFIIDTATKERLCKEEPRSSEILRPILRGRDIVRYGYKWAGLWIIASGYDIDLPSKYPAIFKHLKQFEAKAKERDDQGLNWWNLRACAYYAEFEKEKVVWKRIGSVLRFGYDKNSIYCQDSTCIMTGKDLKYICAFMNSKLGNGLLFDKAPKTGTGDVIVSVQALNPLLIPPITSENRSIAQQIELLVDKILATNESPGFSASSEKQIQIMQLEVQIDQLVYQLYDLTLEEIAIVEGK